VTQPTLVAPEAETTKGELESVLIKMTVTMRNVVRGSPSALERMFL